MVGDGGGLQSPQISLATAAIDGGIAVQQFLPVAAAGAPTR